MYRFTHLHFYTFTLLPIYTITFIQLYTRLNAIELDEISSKYSIIQYITIRLTLFLSILDARKKAKECTTLR